MLEYFRLITTAAKTTLLSPQLWFFGVFLSAGFNFNFLFWHKQDYEKYILSLWLYFLQILQQNVRLFELLVAILILGLILVWVLVNIIKILFIYNAADVLKVETLGNIPNDLNWFKKQKIYWNKTKVRLPSILILSAFTIVMQLLIFLVLASPWIWQKLVAPMPIMLVISSILMFLFLLIFALLNYFSTLYCIFYEQPYNKSFNFSIQLLKFKFVPITLFSIILMALYFIAVLIYQSLVSFPLLLHLLLLGGLNVFFNLALMLLFIKYSRPKKIEIHDQDVAMMNMGSAVDKLG